MYWGQTDPRKSPFPHRFPRCPCGLQAHSHGRPCFRPRRKRSCRFRWSKSSGLQKNPGFLSHRMHRMWNFRPHRMKRLLFRNGFFHSRMSRMCVGRHCGLTKELPVPGPHYKSRKNADTLHRSSQRDGARGKVFHPPVWRICLICRTCRKKR